MHHPKIMSHFWKSTLHSSGEPKYKQHHKEMEAATVSFPSASTVPIVNLFQSLSFYSGAIVCLCSSWVLSWQCLLPVTATAGMHARRDAPAKSGVNNLFHQQISRAKYDLGSQCFSATDYWRVPGLSAPVEAKALSSRTRMRSPSKNQLLAGLLDFNREEY